MTAATRPRGTVRCQECSSTHEAIFSHASAHGGRDVYAVVCSADGLTDYYTDDVVDLDAPPVFGVVSRDATREVVFSSEDRAAAIAYHQTLGVDGGEFAVYELDADDRGDR